MKPQVKAELIAPCGMDCALCMAYQRSKNHCPGCRATDAGKAKSVVACSVPRCEFLRATGAKHCSSKCEKYPCRRLKDLDRRYRAKYHMSMIENLERIESDGIRAFVRIEKDRWSCPSCGSLFCVHTGCCSACGRALGG